MKVPISWRLLDDKLVWEDDKDDIYSVRPAYHRVKEEVTIQSP